MRSATTKPMSLRDLQRALHAGNRKGQMTYEVRKLARQVADLYGVSAEYRWRFSADNIPALLPVVDRLAAKYGPHVLLSDLHGPEQVAQDDDTPLTQGEERKKETDEVHDASSMTSEDTHGGDGRSAEVPDGNSQSGDATGDPRQDARDEQQQNQGQSGVQQEEMQGDQGVTRGQGTADPRGSENATGIGRDDKVAEEPGAARTTTQDNSSAPDAQGPVSLEDSADAAQQQQEREDGETTKCDEGHASEDALPGVPADQAEASTDRTIDSDVDDTEETPKQAGEDRGDPSEKTPKDQEVKATERKLAKMAGEVSRHARNEHGGITAELHKAKIALSLVAHVRSVLASWIADGGQDERSQRWDYTALSARLLTHRSPYPARKTELGRPILLILADVSGSCSGFSNQSVLVSRAIAAQGMPGCDVVIVSHSNGYPLECEVNGLTIKASQFARYKAIADRAGASYRSDGMVGNAAFYQGLIADYSITHVIALGDHDAVDVYSMLAESQDVQQVIWLDNYNCNNQQPKLSQPKVERPAARQAIRYVTGCKDASAFLVGLRVALGG